MPERNQYIMVDDLSVLSDGECLRPFGIEEISRRRLSWFVFICYTGSATICNQCSRIKVAVRIEVTKELYGCSHADSNADHPQENGEKVKSITHTDMEEKWSGRSSTV